MSNRGDTFLNKEGGWVGEKKKFAFIREMRASIEKS